MKKLKSFLQAVKENFWKETDSFRIIKHYVVLYKEGENFTNRKLKKYEYVTRRYFYKPKWHKPGHVIAWDIDIKPDYWVIIRTPENKLKPVQYKELSPLDENYIAGFETKFEADFNMDMAKEWLFTKEELAKLQKGQSV